MRRLGPTSNLPRGPRPDGSPGWPNPHLRFLLAATYSRDSLAPEHLTDLRRSGLTDDTIQLHRIRSVPPHMIRQLVGFDVRAIHSAMLIPFPDPLGGFMDHIRLKVFPSFSGTRGNLVKYLQPRDSNTRLFFCLATLRGILESDAPLWVVEGEKKALAVAQLGLPAVGFCGIEGWHEAGSRELLRDFDHLRLRNRLVELVPDGDWRTNTAVERGAVRFAEALDARGSRVRLVVLPVGVPA
jgi:uncharacterized protein DUF3854